MAPNILFQCPGVHKQAHEEVWPESTNQNPERRVTVGAPKNKPVHLSTSIPTPKKRILSQIKFLPFYCQ